MGRPSNVKHIDLSQSETLNYTQIWTYPFPFRFRISTHLLFGQPFFCNVLAAQQELFTNVQASAGTVDKSPCHQGEYQLALEKSKF